MCYPAIATLAVTFVVTFMIRLSTIAGWLRFRPANSHHTRLAVRLGAIGREPMICQRQGKKRGLGLFACCLAFSTAIVLFAYAAGTLNDVKSRQQAPDAGTPSR